MEEWEGQNPQTTTLFSANQRFVLRTSVPGEHHLPLLGADRHRATGSTLRDDLRISALHKAALDDHAGVPVDPNAEKTLDRILKFREM